MITSNFRGKLDVKQFSSERLRTAKSKSNIQQYIEVKHSEAGH